MPNWATNNAITANALQLRQLLDQLRNQMDTLVAR
jgi:hypothetical protein